MAGGGGKQTEGGPKKARIEIIPLIDVIFFLLATFVLFTLSLDKLSSIPVNLPVANPSPAPPDENMLSIQVSDQGTFYWKIGTGAPEIVNASDLAPRLENYKNSYQTNARVLVRGDIRAKFGAAVQVLDAVRSAGIEQVSVETITSPTGR
ncbi:MAG TPA: biopolymer transporter ExbD [Opitutaceae bacterium]|nr:biopolymer transporter ExbD [Opitutaceae bacterium]